MSSRDARRPFVRLLAALGASAALACTSGGATPLPVPATEPDRWTVVLDSVKTLVAAARHSAADSVLSAFAARSGPGPQAAEATFWRALVAIDPENAGATPRDALVAIDGYLAGGSSQPRFVEATLLRRTAELLERAAEPPIVITPAPLFVTDSLVRLRAAQDTIRQLRAELESTKTELDRIKRRIRPM